MAQFSYGIDALGVAFPSAYVPLEDLALCAERFRGRVTRGAQRGFASLLARLDDRRKLTVAEYEAMFRSRDEPRLASMNEASASGRARFLGVDAGKRVYG